MQAAVTTETPVQMGSAQLLKIKLLSGTGVQSVQPAITVWLERGTAACSSYLPLAAV